MSDERYFEVSPQGKVILPALPRDRRWQYLRIESAAGGPMYGVFKEVASGESPPDVSLMITAAS